jgi:hypothetical protein
VVAIINGGEEISAAKLSGIIFNESESFSVAVGS